jgi:hypothetical protein
MKRNYVVSYWSDTKSGERSFWTNIVELDDLLEMVKEMDEGDEINVRRQ